MAVDRILADALADLSLEPLGIDGLADDSLTAGYSMPEMGASIPPIPPLCCCSCCC